MKTLNKIFILICLVCAIRGYTPAQNRTSSSGPSRTIDSLLQKLETTKQDTTRVFALVDLAELLERSKIDSAILLGNQALLLSQKLKWKKGEAESQFRIGRTYHYKQDFDKAMSHFNLGVSICETALMSGIATELGWAKKLKGRLFSAIATIYNFQADHQNALEYHFKGLKIAEEVGDNQNLAKTLSNIAIVYKAKADYAKALEYYQKGLKISKAMNDKQQIGKTLGNIGSVYVSQANFPNALDCFFKALKIAEENHDKQQIGRGLNDIANVYIGQSNYSTAIEYYLKGLKLSEETGDKRQICGTYGNLASLYGMEHNNAKALEYNLKALKLAEEVEDWRIYSIVLGNTATVYREEGNYSKALEYYLMGLKRAEEYGDKQLIGSTHSNIGVLCTRLGKYKEADFHLKKALAITIEIGDRKFELNTNEALNQLYEKWNRSDLALLYYKKYIALRDTIYSQENNNKLLRSEMDHEYEKKKAVADAEHKVQIENQKLVAAEKTKKQNIVIASVIIGLALVMIFAGFVFRSLRITNKQKLIIEQKNKETEYQKMEIEQKQKEILDSIHYAKRIQMAQIPNEKRVSQILNRLKGHEGK